MLVWMNDQITLDKLKEIATRKKWIEFVNKKEHETTKIPYLYAGIALLRNILI